MRNHTKNKSFLVVGPVREREGVKPPEPLSKKHFSSKDKIAKIMNH